MDTKYITYYFKSAWDMLLDIPLPLNTEIEDDDEGDSYLLLSFPLVGASLGMLLYLVAYILGLILIIPTAAAVIISIVLVLATEMVASSSNLSVLTSFIKAKMERRNIYELEESLNSKLLLDEPLSLILFLSLYLLKLFCFGLLIYHAKTSWIVITFTLSYLVRSQLVTMPSSDSYGALIEEEDDQYAVKMPWIVASVIVIVAGHYYLATSIITLLIAFALIIGFKKYVERTGEMSASMIGVYGVAAELIFLFTGAAIVIRG
jgi:cobalamin synthase